MKTITKTYNVYSFTEASEELKDKIRDNINYNWNLYEFNLEERLETLKKVAYYLDAELDYSISCVPDRGEFIRIKPKYDELNWEDFWEVIDQEKECPLTGVCYDHDIIDQFTKYNMTVDKLNDILNDYLKSIHDEYESMLSDEYLSNHCDANDYMFNENGELE